MLNHLRIFKILNALRSESLPILLAIVCLVANRIPDVLNDYLLDDQ